MKKNEIYEIISEKRGKGETLTDSESQIASSYWTPEEMRQMTWISLKARGCVCSTSVNTSCDVHKQHGQVSHPKVVVEEEHNTVQRVFLD